MLKYSLRVYELNIAFINDRLQYLRQLIHDMPPLIISEEMLKSAFIL